MSSYTFDYVEDGAVVSSTEFNARFNAIKAVIDDLTVDQIAPGAFGIHHGGGVLYDNGQTTPPSFSVEGDEGSHVYDRTTFGNSLKYRSASDWASNDGTDDAGDIGTGRWTMVGHPSSTGAYIGAGGAAAKIVFAPTNVVQAIKIGNEYSERVAGILLSANITINKLDALTCNDVGFTFQFRVNNDPVWYTIKRATRFVSLDDKVLAAATPADGSISFDVPLRCLMIGGDVTAAKGDTNHGVAEVRLMTTVVDNVGDAAELTLTYFNFSALPLRGYI